MEEIGSRNAAGTGKRLSALTAVTVLLLVLGLLLAAAAAGLRIRADRISSGVRDIPEAPAVPRSAAGVVRSYDGFVDRLTAAALENLRPVPKIYRLPEDTVTAPLPDAACFGESDDPADTAEVLARASALLDGQETLWNPEIPIARWSTVQWYLDETILSVTWKQPFRGAIFAFSEIKIAHPSQFRRYFTDDTYASPTRLKTSEMAGSLNAVTALSGDFHMRRPLGIVVYRRQLCRAEGETLDTCFVNGSGDLLFVRRGELTDEAEMRQYIEENDVQFSFCFGPVLIEHGERVLPVEYKIGEINETYARCVLCQLGEGHYLLLTVNNDLGYGAYLPLAPVTDVLMELGIPEAYALDGGQTAAMYANGRLVNAVEFGRQQLISDILYFCTAIPDGAPVPGDAATPDDGEDSQHL
ncbi:MAG: phosphodiester glycosidase family protein [Oscillospiraceae bacterium]|nr:phosphodiester glycosidase family protein [Oscillospiraceae bacterium]